MLILIDNGRASAASIANLVVCIGHLQAAFATLFALHDMYTTGATTALLQYIAVIMFDLETYALD